MSLLPAGLLKNQILAAIHLAIKKNKKKTRTKYIYSNSAQTEVKSVNCYDEDNTGVTRLFYYYYLFYIKHDMNA